MKILFNLLETRNNQPIQNRQKNIGFGSVGRPLAKRSTTDNLFKTAVESLTSGKGEGTYNKIVDAYLKAKASIEAKHQACLETLNIHWNSFLSDHNGEKKHLRAIERIWHKTQDWREKFELGKGLAEYYATKIPKPDCAKAAVIYLEIIDFLKKKPDRRLLKEENAYLFGQMEKLINRNTLNRFEKMASKKGLTETYTFL